ncbi:MAG TPA: nucleotidyltransferase domain-containing protein [Chitinophagaceae bacterium]|nr:nucleotidyltransferase domain-containing protein [Chitinophagaceae bacterium]
MSIVTSHIAQIQTLCKENKVKELYVFGSVLTTNFKDDSDIDLLVDFFDLPPTEYTNRYFNLKFSLEEVFGRPVDLLERESLKNPYLIQAIDLHKELVYPGFQVAGGRFHHE